MNSRWLATLALSSLLAGPSCVAEEDPPTASARRPEDLLKSAVEAAGNDEVPKAIGLVEQALKASPDNRDGLYLLAVLASSHAAEVKGPAEKVAMLRKATDAFGKIKAKYSALSPRELDFAPRARLAGVKAMALEGQAGPAMAEILDMLAGGYDDLEAIETDPDLDAVRKLPGFAPGFAGAIKAGVVKELAAARTFPFGFSLQDADNRNVTLADFQGKVTLVDIWGTWCPPCRQEIPILVDLDKEYRPKGLEIVGINCNEEGSAADVRKVIKDFSRANRIEYRCLVNDDKTESKVPNFRGYPTTLFLDRSGKVRLAIVGAAPKVRLEAIITALLAEDAKP